MKELVLAAMLVAVAAVPAGAQQQKPAKASAPSQAPAQPAARIDSIPQLCRYREAEILQYNRIVGERMAEARQETDKTKSAALITNLTSLRNNLAMLEASWQRLGCTSLVYGAPPK